MRELVYDCFLFFNEFDLLEVRLNVLSELVDKFVLVEADRTFSNKEKPFYFDEKKEKYKEFLGKIIHIKVCTYTAETKNAWDMEYYQRNQIVQGITQCSDKDIILISDLDEIPNPEIIKDYKLSGNGLCKLRQLHFDYYLNFQRIGANKYWYPAKIARYKDIVRNNYTPQQIRTIKDIKIIKNGGWHFSFLGGIENIKYKIQSFSHQEWNNEKYLNDEIEKKIHKGIDLFDRKDRRLVPVRITEKRHPLYIVKNREKYPDLIYSPINYFIVIKNYLFCFPYILLSKLAQFIKILLPKKIIQKIKEIKNTRRNKKYNVQELTS